MSKYKKHRKYCSRLHKKRTQNFSVIVIHQKYETIKHFRKLFSLFFSEKRKITNKITLADEDETVISDDAQLISEELNQFFKNATKTLNIRETSSPIYKSELSDPVNKSISKYKNLPSILLNQKSCIVLLSESFICLILKKS